MSQKLPDIVPEELPPLQGSSLAMVIIAISLATFMEVLDMTIVNVSLPAISGTLGVSPTEGTWAISSYSLAAAIMQPLTGWLGKRFGEVRTFVGSGLLFVTFSALCGLSTSMSMLVTGRILQGLVSGPMVPMAQALMLRNAPPSRRGIAMAAWGMVIFIAPMCGPVLGGYITDNFSWPWLFFINVPIGLAAIAIAGTLLRKRETRRTPVRFDAVGLVLLVIGVGSLQFMLDRGNEFDWFESGIIIAAAAAAVVALSLLIAWELTDKRPTLGLHLFAHRNFRVGLLCLCLGTFCFFGALVLFPMWLQTTVGYTALWAGLAAAPIGILGIVVMPILGANIQRINLRFAATFGFFVFAFVMFWTSILPADADFVTLALPRLVQGIGLAFFFLPLQQIMYSDVLPHEIAAASGLASCLRSIASSTSAAISVYLWTRRVDYHEVVLGGNLHAGATWSDWVGRFGQLADGAGAQLAASGKVLMYTQTQLVKQAQTLAINDVMFLFGCVFLALVPLVWLARPPFRGDPGAAAH